MRDVLTKTHSKDQVGVVQGDKLMKELKRKNEEIGDLDSKLNQLRVLCSTLEETCHNQDAELRVLRVQKTELGVASEDGETKRVRRVIEGLWYNQTYLRTYVCTVGAPST